MPKIGKRALEQWLRGLEPDQELAARLAILNVAPDYAADRKFGDRLDALRLRPSSDPDRMMKLLGEAARLSEALRENLGPPAKPPRRSS